MTVEERFERIEHITASLVEQSSRDREENRQLWRDTQRQIADLGRKIADTNDAVLRFAAESQAADQQLRERMEAADQQLRERIDSVDQRLGGRIEALVSAIGKMLASK